MREILFQGKRIDNGEWVEGSYAFQYGCHEILLPSTDGEYGFDRYFIYPETVGQFTGLTDRNGKKIFEGDILYSIYSKKNYPVLFGEYTYVDDYGDEQGACGWYNEEGDYKMAFGNPEDWAEVIGNIHDNPELLKDGE